jgi:hypothetical protein
MMEFSVLISDTASAPPSIAAFAAGRMLVMLGVSFTITGTRANFLHQAAACWMYSGTWPTAEPMPRSLIPCGQPKLSSRPSQPVSSIMGTYFATISARSGQSRFTWRISARFVASGRSVISSMLLKPMTRRSLEWIAP